MRKVPSISGYDTKETSSRTALHTNKEVYSTVFVKACSVFVQSMVYGNGVKYNFQQYIRYTTTTMTVWVHITNLYVTTSVMICRPYV